MATIAEYLTNLGTRLTSKLDAINNKLVAKGQPRATDLDGVPALIEAISTGTDTNISSNAASASDIRSGKKAYVNGSLITGNMSSVSVPTPTVNVTSAGVVTANVSQSAGYTAGGSKTSNSVTLSETHCSTFLPENIAKGVTIFGKTGTFAGGMKYVQGTVSVSGDSMQLVKLNYDTDDCDLKPGDADSRIRYIFVFASKTSDSYADNDVAWLFIDNGGASMVGNWTSDGIQIDTSFTINETIEVYVDGNNNFVYFYIKSDYNIDANSNYYGAIFYE